MEFYMGTLAAAAYEPKFGDYGTWREAKAALMRKRQAELFDGALPHAQDGALLPKMATASSLSKKAHKSKKTSEQTSGEAGPAGTPAAPSWSSPRLKRGSGKVRRPLFYGDERAGEAVAAATDAATSAPTKRRRAKRRGG